MPWKRVFIHFCHDFMHVHKPRADNPKEHTFYVKWNLLLLWPAYASLKTICLNWDFIHFSQAFRHGDSPGAGADHSWGQSVDFKWNLLSLWPAGASLKHLIELWLNRMFFVDYLHVYSLRQAQITPGDKVLMSGESCCHYGQLGQLKKSLWTLWSYTILFSWFYTCT